MTTPKNANARNASARMGDSKLFHLEGICLAILGAIVCTFILSIIIINEKTKEVIWWMKRLKKRLELWRA